MYLLNAQRKLKLFCYFYTVLTPEIVGIYKDKAFDEKSLLGMVVNSQMFCDSDKYSFCLAMQSLPADQQTFMRSKLNGEDSIFNDLKISENPTEQKI